MLLSSLYGCSNKEVYTAIQNNRQLECQKLPQVQYDECMSEYGQAYDEYEADRNKIISEE